MAHPLQRKIAAVRSRLRRLTIGHASAWTVATVLGVVVGLGALDYLIRFQDRGIRLICSALALAALAWAGYRYLFSAWIVRLRDVDLAARIQRRFPALGDRLVSAVDFLRQPEDDPIAGSAALRRLVIAQTAAETEQLDFRKVLDPWPVIRAAMATVAVCLLAAILVVLRPLDCQIAVARLVNPLGNDAWPQKTHLKLRSPVSRVARGRAFEVQVVDTDKAARLPPQVEIHYRFSGPDGGVIEQSEPMRPRGDTMVARRENVMRPFAYRVSGGDDDSMPWISVEVVEPPRIDSLSITLVPPPYTGWPPQKADGHVHALAGTRMSILANATKPLNSALLRLDGGMEIPGRIHADRHCFTVGRPSGGTGEAPEDPSPPALAPASAQTPSPAAADELLIETPGTYWFQLTDSEGLSGGAEQRWDIRAVADAPPTVAIEEPLANLFVTPLAVVPLRVAAKDDLAVKSIVLVVAPAGELKPGEPAQDAERLRHSELPLYTGPERSQPKSETPQVGGAESGDRRMIEHVWELAELALQPGDQITFHATACDYRPQTGNSEPRRLAVITPEELQDRLAGRQSLILAELARAVQMQRGNRSQVDALQIRSSEVGQLDRHDVDRLRAAELNQRQVGRSLTSRSEGVTMHVVALLADIQNNRVDSPDLQRRMEALLAAIDRLGREHLPVVGRELTAAIKSAEISLQQPPDAKDPPTPKSDTSVTASLVSAREHQDQVIASLQTLLEQLARWDDKYRRFYRDVSQLLRDQQEISARSGELRSSTLAKEIGDLPPQQRADLKVLAAGQFELAGRLGRVLDAMGRAVEPLRSSDPLAADTVADALDTAERLSIGGKMRTAHGHLQTNRLGRAVQQQRQVAEDLQEVLDVLANRRRHELARLTEKMHEVETELAQLEQQQAALAAELQENAQAPDDTRRQERLQKLGHEQDQIQQRTQQAARRLEHLQADQASRTTSRAAAEMGQASQCAGGGNCQGACQGAQQAQRSLQEARRQLEQRLRQAQAELTVERLAQLEDTVKDLRRQQQGALDETARLQRSQAQRRLTRAQAAALSRLARQQQALRSQTVQLGEQLAGAAAFQIALSGVADEMAHATERLQQRLTDAETQATQQNALRRLDLLTEALKPEAPQAETPEEAPDTEADAGAGDGGEAGAGQGGYSDAKKTLLQLKVLRLLQQDVGLRTRALPQGIAADDALTTPQRGEFALLSEEQGQLADGVSQLPTETPEQSPLVPIAGKMRDAETLIARHDAGTTTEQLQQTIVSDLDRLLEQARKRCQQCKPGNKPSQPSSRKPKKDASGTPSDKPATTSSTKPGPGEARQPDVEQVRRMMERLWGDLPQRQRQRMLQLPADERFLPKYETLIEDYFRRLTQEKESSGS